MSRNDLTIVSPSIVETQLTGFLGAAERTIRNVVFRVEWHAGQAPNFSKDGVSFPIDRVGADRSMLKLAKDSRPIFCPT